MGESPQGGLHAIEIVVYAMQRHGNLQSKRHQYHGGKNNIQVLLPGVQGTSNPSLQEGASLEVGAFYFCVIIFMLTIA